MQRHQEDRTLYAELETCLFAFFGLSGFSGACGPINMTDQTDEIDQINQTVCALATEVSPTTLLVLRSRTFRSR